MRCNARLTAGWLSSNRLAARETFRSSASTEKTTRRFKSAWRSCVIRIHDISIMHWTYVTARFNLFLATDFKFEEAAKKENHHEKDSYRNWRIPRHRTHHRPS